VIYIYIYYIAPWVLNNIRYPNPRHSQSPPRAPLLLRFFLLFRLLISTLEYQMETQADDIVRGSSSFRTPPIPVVPYSHPRDPDAIGSPASAPARSPRKAIEEGGDVPIPNPDGGGAVVALPRFFGVIPTWPPRIQGSGPHDGSAWILVASSLLHACAPWHVAHGGRQRRRRRVCCRG
jgi:hypothetical protein